jgi:uncharacterized membrane protein YkvA (DUF1232 family)
MVEPNRPPALRSEEAGGAERETALVARLRRWAQGVRRDARAIYSLAHDPRVPWYAKALAMCVAAYAFSPVDLIPDFIPVLGYLDDVVVVPLGILLVTRLIPPTILAEHREAAAAAVAEARPAPWVGAALVLGLWVWALLAILLLWAIWPRFVR